jgi:hypothetical protein
MEADPPEPAEHHAGRPRKATPGKVAEIERLRADGLSWPDIGRLVALNPETCRRAVWAVKKARGAVRNSAGPVNNPAQAV